LDNNIPVSVPPGTQITVVYSEQRFAPVQYHSFGIGPFTTVVTVADGETGMEAFIRGYTFLQACARAIYTATKQDFMDRAQGRI
jgi:hypothetical protein